MTDVTVIESVVEVVTEGPQGPGSGGPGGAVDWADVTGKPDTFPPSAHGHAATEVTQDATHRFVTDAEKAAWNGKEAAGTAAAAVAAHVLAADPHGDRAYADSQLSGKAPLASPALTGTPTAPTAPDGTSTTQLATTQFVITALAQSIANLINSAPGALDTLNELAQALGSDPNFAATVNTALANRVRVDTAAQGLSGTQQANARANIGAGTSSFDGAYASLSGLPTLGTAASLNHGTAAGNLVRLDASTGKLPPVDGSQLTNLPSGGAPPGGSGAELQYRAGASTFGALTGSSVSGADLHLGGVLSVPGNGAQHYNLLRFNTAGNGYTHLGGNNGHFFVSTDGTFNGARFACYMDNRTNAYGPAVPISHQYRWSSTSSATGNPGLGLECVSAGVLGVNDGSAGVWRDVKLRNLIATGRIDLPQYTTATRPTHVNGALIFDSDIDKALIGGASAWEAITSA